MNASRAIVLLLAAASGFVALGYEIVWARLYNFVSASRGEAFSALLGSYLTGLATGSALSRRWHKVRANGATPMSLVICRLLLASTVLSSLVLPLVVWGISTFDRLSAHPLYTLPFVAIAALALGIVLPLLCHFSIATEHAAGQSVGLIYFANIVGSGTGTLLTGFVFLDRFGTAATNTILLVIGTILAVLLAWHSRSTRLADWLGVLFAVSIAVTSPWLHRALFPRLFFRSAYTPQSRVSQIVETRNGVIIVDTNNTVFGNNVYDGIINTRLVPGTGLIRPYFISAIHPAPREILVIGVSGGAWTQILAHHPQVEKVTAVEISRGYIEVIRQHDAVASVLSNPKVELVIDDGRRWLKRHPERRFDAIVMNTTWHWREFASALLSKEFLELARAHLKPGGVVMWNATGSPRAIRTAMEVFPHTLLVMNNCVGSMEPFTIDRARWRQVLASYEIDGKPLFDLPAQSEVLDEVVSFGLSRKYATAHWFIRDRSEMEKRYGAARVITDDNLGDEYRSILPEILNWWPWYAKTPESIRR